MKNILILLLFIVPLSSMAQTNQEKSSKYLAERLRDSLSLTEKEYQSLERIVSMAFAQRRKVLRNNLSSVKDVLQLSDDVLGLRAQDISVEDYISWARQLAH